MAQRFDAIVIGAGQAGPSLAVRLAGSGRKVALVERRTLGGTCVNDGCIPTKTLIASARAAWVARNAAAFGVRIDGDVTVDMRAVKARKDAVVQQSRDGLRTWLAGTANLTLVDGHARFTSPRSIRVGDDDLDADELFVNVGGRAVVPDVLQAVPHLTNSSMMDVDFLPEHLVVVGGSYVGLEFAQMYRRFGSRVTIVEHGARLVSREDPEVSAEIQRILVRDGIDVHVTTNIVAATESAGRIALRTTGASLDASHVLVAVGRRANTDDLGLEHAGVRVDARGMIEVDDQLRSNVAHIWAIGDVNGRGAFTHTSYNDYEIVAANLLDGATRRVGDRIPIYALYIDPPLGRVGMNRAEARASGLRVSVARYPMSRVGRARERGETDGFIEILVDTDSRRILGATILGIEGDEVIHAIADVMYARAPYTVIARAVHAHPTVSELLPTALQQLTPLD
jgi:pyruvate/2-oxoglutarate dehydrogenase complex dihydrolipoamide dehydrogenase (E3) component